MTSNLSMHQAGATRANAALFSALGDSMRLNIVTRLAHEGPRTISTLVEHATITRQAITKHIQVLEQAGLVTSQRQGRERIIELRPERLAAVHRYLDQISRQWDDAIVRLSERLESGQ